MLNDPKIQDWLHNNRANLNKEQEDKMMDELAPDLKYKKNGKRNHNRYGNKEKEYLQNF